MPVKNKIKKEYFVPVNEEQIEDGLLNKIEQQGYKIEKFAVTAKEHYNAFQRLTQITDKDIQLPRFYTQQPYQFMPGSLYDDGEKQHSSVAICAIEKENKRFIYFVYKQNNEFHIHKQRVGFNLDEFAENKINGKRHKTEQLYRSGFELTSKIDSLFMDKYMMVKGAYFFQWDEKEKTMKCRLLPFYFIHNINFTIGILETKQKKEKIGEFEKKLKPYLGSKFTFYSWVEDTEKCEAMNNLFLFNEVDKYFDCEDNELQRNESYLLLGFLHNITVIDIDTDKPGQKLREIKKNHPYTLSSTKGFPHIYVRNVEHLRDYLREKLSTQKKIKCKSGMWKMSHEEAPPMKNQCDGGEIMNTWIYEKISGRYVFNCDKDVESEENYFKQLIPEDKYKKWNAKVSKKKDKKPKDKEKKTKEKEKKTKEKEKKTKEKKEKDEEVKVSDVKFYQRGLVYEKNYPVIRDNLDALFGRKMKNREGYLDSRAIILCGASTGDPKILDIYHEVCNKHCKWYEIDGENWVNEQWNDYYKMGKEAKKQWVFRWYERVKFGEGYDAEIAKLFLKIYSSVFLYNMKDRTLYVFDAKTNLYTADEKRVKGIFFDILQYDFIDLCKKFIDMEEYDDDYIDKCMKRDKSFGKWFKNKRGLFNFEIKKKKTEETDGDATADEKTDDENDDEQKVEKEDSMDKEPERKHYVEYLRHNKLAKYIQLKNVAGAQRIFTEVTILVCSGKYNTINVNMNYNEEERTLFHFKTGYYDFVKDTFVEKRSIDNYTTICLDYDYKPLDDNIKAKMEEIKRDIEKIHPDDDMREMWYRWQGYCLTGFTQEEKMLYNCGITAGNGKTTLTEIGNKCFPVYWTNIDSKAFNTNTGNNSEKTFAQLLANPRRKLTMEETKMDKDKFDANLWKTHISGGTITVRPLYQNEQVIPAIFYKLETNSNYSINFISDEGVKRRGIMLNYTSQFKKTEDEIDEENFIFLARKDMVSRFEDDNYKLAYFHLLKEYAVKYCREKTLKIPQACIDAFSEQNETELKEMITDIFEVDKNLNAECSKLSKKHRKQEENKNLSIMSDEEKERFKEVKKELKDEYTITYKDLETFFTGIGIFDDYSDASNLFWKTIKECQIEVNKKKKLDISTQEQRLKFLLERAFYDKKFYDSNSTKTHYNFSSFQKNELVTDVYSKRIFTLVNTKISRFIGIKIKDEKYSTLKYLQKFNRTAWLQKRDDYEQNLDKEDEDEEKEYKRLFPTNYDD